MIGIYKITSPTKRIYIGQSLNIEKRFKHYYSYDCKGQPRLYNSLLKHGIKKHSFEIIHYCTVLELNELERYYQDLYNCLNSGLNCTLTTSKNSVGYLSMETKNKISKSTTGNKNHFFNKTHSDETKLKIKLNRTGLKATNETKLKMSNTRKGVLRGSFSDTHKKNISLAKSNTKNPKKCKTILDIQTGVFYYSVLEICDLYKLKYSTLRCKLNGSDKNNTQWIYV